MRINLTLLAGILLVSSPAFAGSIAITNDQVTWQSTKCQAPVQPPELAALGHHAPADKVNKNIALYNDYASQSQTYMDCVSQEAQTDSKSVSDAITAAAQHQIDDQKQKVTALTSTTQVPKRTPRPPIDAQ